jgi:hypothetical protein
MESIGFTRYSFQLIREKHILEKVAWARRIGSGNAHMEIQGL